MSSQFVACRMRCGTCGEKSLPAASRGSRVRRGFTLTEVLVVIAIVLLVVSLSPILRGSLETASDMDTRTAELRETLRRAQTRSIAGLEDARHGVYFDIDAAGPDSYVLYQGGSFVLRDAMFDEKKELPAVFSLQTSFGNEVNFSRGRGVPHATGTITLVHETAGSRTTTVYDSGLITVDVE